MAVVAAAVAVEEEEEEDGVVALVDLGGAAAVEDARVCVVRSEEWNPGLGMAGA